MCWKSGQALSACWRLTDGIWANVQECREFILDDLSSSFPLCMQWQSKAWGRAFGLWGHRFLSSFPGVSRSSVLPPTPANSWLVLESVRDRSRPVSQSLPSLSGPGLCVLITFYLASSSPAFPRPSQPYLILQVCSPRSHIAFMFSSTST